MSHSKRNTSLAFFTSYERELLKTSWGPQQARLTSESFLPFGACRLCLMPAVSPVACAGETLSAAAPTAVTKKTAAATNPQKTGLKRKRDDGCVERCHVFCRECVVKNLVAQTAKLEQLKKQAAAQAAGAAADEVYEAEQARQKQIDDFDRAQSGLSSTSSKPRSNYWRQAQAGDIKDETSLPSFWTPGQQSDVKKRHHDDKPAKEVKMKTICPMSTPGESHALSVSTWTGVEFNRDAKQTPICPACNKALSNSSKPIMARPCGHVLCQKCVDQFVLIGTDADWGDHVLDDSKPKSIACYVCSADLTRHSNQQRKIKGRSMQDESGKSDKGAKKTKVEPGLIEIACDGTGYAAGGQNMIKKAGVNFQFG